MRPTLMMLSVRRFERCLRFYREVFGVQPFRVYRGREHPRWAEFQLGSVRFALHGGHEGQPFRQEPGGRPLEIGFDTANLRRTLAKIRRAGGAVKGRIRRVKFIPEREVADVAVFVDPAGNEFSVAQVVQRLTS